MSRNQKNNHKLWLLIRIFNFKKIFIYNHGLWLLIGKLKKCEIAANRERYSKSRRDITTKKKFSLPMSEPLSLLKKISDKM